MTNKGQAKSDSNEVNSKRDDQKQDSTEQGQVGNDVKHGEENAKLRAALTKAEAKTVFPVQVIERLHAANSFLNKNTLLLLEQLNGNESKDQEKAKAAHDNASRVCKSIVDHVNDVADMLVDRFPKLIRDLQHGDNFEQTPDFRNSCLGK